MAQQTAVEWLVDNLPQRFKNIMLLTGEKIIEQAKEMEKEQIKNAWKADSFLSREDDDIKSEQYYNKTYNK